VQAVALQRVSPRLADALRARHSHKLTKELLMALLAHWSYRSDAWRRRGNRVVHAPAAAAATALPQQQLQLASQSAPALRAPPTLAYELADCGIGSGAEVSAAVMWLHLRSRLRPLCAEVERLMAGPAARALAMRDHAAAASYAQHLPLVRAAAAHVSVEKMPHIAVLLAEARACGAAAAPRPEALLGVESMLVNGISVYEAQAEESTARVAHPDAALADVVWHSEMLSLQRISIDLCVRLVALLAHCRRASPVLYADVGAACIEALKENLGGMLSAHERRAAWITDAADVAGGACGRAVPALLLPAYAHDNHCMLLSAAAPTEGGGGSAPVASCA
jgi:hypothetical protein